MSPLKFGKRSRPSLQSANLESLQIVDRPIGLPQDVEVPKSLADRDEL